MGSQRQLNALLFELQTAQSPLAQAKILARAWRTVRELSPTDRKLLARHAGFDGAEEILEGLAKKKGGMAPAMLLQMLTNARATDASTLRNLLSAFRDPSRRDEALSRSLDLAADLMRDQEPSEEADAASDDVDVAELVVEDSPEEALQALEAIEKEHEAGPVEGKKPAGREMEAAPELERETSTEPAPAPPEPSAAPPPDPAPEQPPTPRPSMVDWSRWDRPGQAPRPAPTPRSEVRSVVSTSNARRSGDMASAADVVGESSVLARLRALDRALPELAGSSGVALEELIEAFPDGWVRRRALSALIDAGIPTRAEDAVTLVGACLARELDRRWCLRALADRGDLRGASLDRASELLSSPSARRRLSASVIRQRSES